LEVNASGVSIGLVVPWFFFDVPFVWMPTDLEFNRQPRRINSYVGLRSHGRGEEWTWFHTRSLNEVCASLASVGATEVVEPPLQVRDILPITLAGSVLVTGIGLLVLAVAQIFTARDAPENHIISAGLHGVGLIVLLIGMGFGVVHLWGRLRSRLRS
jgi:hypothetical protein